MTTKAGRGRTPLLGVLVFLAILTFFYHVLPTLTATTEYVTSSLVSRLRSQNIIKTPEFCTSEIGHGQCCELYLGAQPCVDQCRKEHTDRETFTLTADYDTCEQECLVVYQTACGQDGAVKEAPPTITDDLKKRKSSLRRRRESRLQA